MEDLPLLPDADEIIQIHAQQLARFGGASGIRDRNGIESAVGRTQNLFAYSEAADAVSAAVALCHSLVKNHAFVDGNKPAAFGALEVTLALNGLKLVAPQPEITGLILGMATSDTSQAQAEAWVRARTVKAG